MRPCPAEVRLGQWRKCLTAVTVRHAPSNFNRSQPSRVYLSSSSACGVPPPTANLERWPTFRRVAWVENASSGCRTTRQTGISMSHHPPLGLWPTHLPLSERPRGAVVLQSCLNVLDAHIDRAVFLRRVQDSTFLKYMVSGDRPTISAFTADFDKVFHHLSKRCRDGWQPFAPTSRSRKHHCRPTASCGSRRQVCWRKGSFFITDVTAHCFA